MRLQLEHRSHWKLAVPPHAPGPAVAVKAWPTCAAPAIVGGESIDGVGTRPHEAPQSPPLEVSGVGLAPSRVVVNRLEVYGGDELPYWSNATLVPSGATAGMPLP